MFKPKVKLLVTVAAAALTAATCKCNNVSNANTAIASTAAAIGTIAFITAIEEDNKETN